MAEFTLALVADRADGIGGPPVIAVTARVGAGRPDALQRMSRPAGPRPSGAEIAAGYRELHRRLATHPALRPYLE
jgi:hypothetical protein